MEADMHNLVPAIGEAFSETIFNNTQEDNK